MIQVKLGDLLLTGHHGNLSFNGGFIPPWLDNDTPEAYNIFVKAMLQENRHFQQMSANLVTFMRK